MPETIKPPYLDHLALGVESWDQGWSAVVDMLGGVWSMGGDAGEFSPCQLTYRDGMRLELIAPSANPNGFMRRFLDEGGPRAHHLTFHVQNLDATLTAVAALGIESIGRAMLSDVWEEAFLHPKQAGLGTLVQVIEVHRGLEGAVSPIPGTFPSSAPEARSFAWIGLSVDSIDHSDALLAGVLGGEILESGADWRMYSWGSQRRILVRSNKAVPGAPQLWTQTQGVNHLMLGEPGLSPNDVIADDLNAVFLANVGLNCWEIARSKLS